jgi:endoglucanase
MANKKRIAKTFGASLLASAMTASAVVPAFAGENLGTTNFDNGVGLPWHICESGANTNLEFAIEDGVYRIWILNPGGESRGGESIWDCQFRHRKLSIIADHTYTVEYTITSNMSGFYKTKIGDFSGNVETWHNEASSKEYYKGWEGLTLTANTPHSFTGDFSPAANNADDHKEAKTDLEAAEWTFQFGGKGTYGAPGGDAFPASSWYSKEADIKAKTFREAADSGECPMLEFDDMSLFDETGSDNDWVVAINPYDQAIHNAVRVNQIGYYTNLQKKATVVLENGDTGTYDFEVKDSSGKTVKSGTTGNGFYDPDSGQWVAILDFSTVTDKGDGFYIQMDSKYKAPSGAGVVETDIGTTRSYPFTISDNLYKEAIPTDGKPVVSDGTEFDDDYSDNDYTNGGKLEYSLFTNAFNYFYNNRATISIDKEFITSGDNTTTYPGVGTMSKEDMFDGTLAGKAGLSREPNLGFDKGYIQITWVKSYGAVGNVETSNGELEDLDRGWFDAGDCGKYVVNGGISDWTLENTYERALKNGTEEDLNDRIIIPDSDSSAASYNDVLKEVKWELDFFLDMIVEAEDPASKPYIDSTTNGAAMDMTGLVYHKFHDYKWTGLALAPELDGLTRVVKPPSTAATCNAVATFAQSARLFGTDSAYGKTLLDAAKSSYEAAKTVKFEGDYIYAPLDQAIGGGAYGDTEVRDDLYWAACELYITTGDEDYWKDVEDFKIDDMKITLEDGDVITVGGQEAFKLTSELGGGENKGSFTSFNWGCTAGLGTLSLWLNKDVLEAAGHEDAVATMEASICEIADDFLDRQNGVYPVSRKNDNKETVYEDEDGHSLAANGYGIPYTGATFTDPINAPNKIFTGYEWGSNSFVINNSIVLAYAYDISGDAKYVNGIITSMDYLLGRNAMDFSYVTGYGEFHLVNPHHRYWSFENDKNYPLAPAGVLSGGPNLGMQDPYIQGAGFDPTGTPSQFCYIDSTESWSTNEVTINWNSPLVWITKYLDDVAPTVDGIDITDPGEDKGKTTTTTKGGGGSDPTDVVYGDDDDDGQACKITDVILLSKHVSKKLQLPAGSAYLANADVNQKVAGAVDTNDLKTVIDVLLGTESLSALPIK